jgi:two-component system invasion response regulator UvrY
MRILIVDANAVVRRGLREIIADEFGGCAFGEAADGETAVAEIEARAWDLVLLDISLPGRSGIGILDKVKRLRPALPVLALTMRPDRHYAVCALRRGAGGYITKDAPPRDLLDAVRRVLRGQKYVSPRMAGEFAAQAAGPGGRSALSRRERQVISSLLAGSSVSEIAAAMDLSAKTVSTYRARAFRKLCLRTDFELARYAIEHGLEA